MKKLFTLFLALAASVGTLFASLMDNKLIDGIYYDIAHSSAYATVTFCSTDHFGLVPASYTGCYTGDITLPSTVRYSRMGGLNPQDYSVQRIGDNAFCNCPGLTSLTLPTTMRSIGKNAFQGCSGLNRINVSDLSQWCTMSFEDSPLSYAHNLYVNNQLLTNLVVPSDVTSISAKAFQGSNITSITIHSDVTSIGADAFKDCANLTNIYYQGTLEQWCSHDFSGLMKNWAGGNLYIQGQLVTQLIIPANITNIPNYAFSKTNITSVTIPASVTSIGEGAFNGCSNLNGINIPDLAAWCRTSFAAGPFATVPNLYLNNQLVTNLVIPSTVTAISANAFGGCKSITSVTIPASVTSMGENAFNGCTNLNRVDISDLAAWCGIAFADNPLSYAHNLYLNGVLIAELEIPTGVTAISAKAFNGATCLTSVSIPAAVTSIGEKAFTGCTNLTRIDISDLAAWCGIAFADNPLSYAHNLYLNEQLITELEIPDSVAGIGAKAFEGDTNILSVAIPASVTSMGEKAFNGCTNLTRIDISDLAAWCGITFGDNPLSFVHDLYLNEQLITNLEIPADVAGIGAKAFEGDTNIVSVTIPASVASMGVNAFNGCPNITSVAWNAINSNAFNFGSQVTSFVFGDEVQQIPANICSGMTLLESITLPSSVTGIGENAFNGCTGLTAITIPDNVTAIGENAFVGTGITSVEWNAKNCSSYHFGNQITSFIFGDKVLHIPANVCEGMNLLTSVTIPASVSGIGDKAFFDCPNLTAVYCESASPAVIADSTFSPCQIYVPNCAYTAFFNAPVWKDLNLSPVNINLAVVNNVGGMVVENCGLMEIEAIPYFNYHFKRWQDGNTDNPRKYTLAQTKRNFIAEFALDQYLITFLNADSTVLCAQEWELGAVPSCADPTKEDDEQFIYTFAGWSPEVVAVTGEATYVATYTAEPKPEGIEITNDQSPKTHKILRDNHIFILRGEKVYTLQGQEVK